MPQKSISIWMSVLVGSRRAIVVEPSGDVALVAEKAFALYMAVLWMQCTAQDVQKLVPLPSGESLPNSPTQLFRNAIIGLILEARHAGR